MQAVAGYLRELRAAAGLTQTDAAGKIGMSYKSVERWEAGKGEPPITTLATYVQALNGSVARLISMILGRSFTEGQAKTEDAVRFAELQSAIKNASDTSLDAFSRYLNLVAAGVDPTVAARQVLGE